MGILPLRAFLSGAGMKGLVFYVVAGVSIASVAVAQQPTTPELLPEQLSQTSEDSPRRLTIKVSVADPSDLKVKQGDRIQAGDLIADRGRARQRLETQQQQLALTLQRLQTATITPPLPPANIPAIVQPTYLEEEAAISKAQAMVDQAEHAISTKHQELDYLQTLDHLNPLVLEHEQAKLEELQRQHTAAVRDYQLAVGRKSSAEYHHRLTLTERAERQNQTMLSYQRQWAEYEQRLRNRDFQVAQTQLKLDEVENQIASIAVVRAPYSGTVRRVKWVGQGSDGQLSAEVTLMVNARDRAGDSLTLPRQQREVSGDVDGFGYPEQQ